MRFRQELEELLNRYNKENGSDTPDFILAEYLLDCIANFDTAVTKREKWYGRFEAFVDKGILSTKEEQ